MLRRTILTFFTNNSTKLGRWEHRNNAHINDLKVILANKDNCGDSICGTPKPINDILEETKFERNTNGNGYENSFTTK
jgi:hypothetical protein